MFVRQQRLPFRILAPDPCPSCGAHIAEGTAAEFVFENDGLRLICPACRHPHTNVRIEHGEGRRS